MRIGYLMQNGAPDLSTQSGPQLHVTEVVSGLKRAGHTVRTLAYQRQRLGWSDDLHVWNAPVYGFSKSKIFRLFESAVRRVQYELHLPFIGMFDSLHFADAGQQLLQNFDILYERHGYMGYGGVIASRWLKIPIVIEINGNIVKEIDENGVQMSNLQRKIGRWVTYKTWNAATHLLVVSEALKNQLVQVADVKEENITVLQNGANVELFTRTFNSREVAAKYDLESCKVIAFTGSFQPWHGVELLVDSFDFLAGKYPDSRLVLIGNGQGKESVKAMVGSLGLEPRVLFAGHLPQEEVASLLSVADILVAPYPYRHADILGSPLKLIEYMAAGKAIVATKAPIHELIVDGSNGIRVDPADAVALAEGIDKLLATPDLRRRLGENARRQAIENYSWERVVIKLEKLLYDLVEKSERRELR